MVKPTQSKEVPMSSKQLSNDAPTGGSLFAVIREGGARWDHAEQPQEQDAWDEHLAFMGGLAESGFVVLGGWLADAPRTLLVVEAHDEAEVRSRFEDDPYTAMEMLSIKSVEPWELLLGRELLTAVPARA
jgi:uncharacterized protein